MKHASSQFLQSIRGLTIAASLLISVAHADEYADVSQLIKAGKLPDALAKAEQYLAGKPRDPQMRFIKGVIQRDSGKTTDAIGTFTRLTEDYPELPEPYNNLAVLYASQTQFDKARTALEMAIRTNPSYATAHENLGDVYAKLASQAYTKALQLDTNNQAVAPKLALIRELFSPAGNKPRAGTAPATLPAATAAPAATTATRLPPALPAPLPGKAPVAATAAAPAAVTPAPVVTPSPAPAAATVAAKPVAPPAPASVTPAVGTNASADVEAAVRAWAKAWSSKDVKGYLAAYGKDFNPPGAQSRSAWEEQRRGRIGNKANISVKLENVTVSVTGDKAIARFRQDYKAGALAVSSRKSLELVKTGDRWQITKESVGG